MVIGGILNAFYGLIAVVNDEWVVWGNRASVYLDISQWGWIHLIIGVVVVVAGVGVLRGNFLARSVGVVAASASLIINFGFVPAYPIWSLVVVAIDVIVIWALIAHGKEMKDPLPSRTEHGGPTGGTSIGAPGRAAVEQRVAR